MATLTTTQIDRLGERLKLDELSEVDLRALDDYRRSFATEYKTVLDVIRDQLGLQPTEIDPGLKYGRGVQPLQAKLEELSAALANQESVENMFSTVRDLVITNPALPDELRNKMEDLEKRLDAIRDVRRTTMQQFLVMLPELIEKARLK